MNRHITMAVTLLTTLSIAACGGGAGSVGEEAADFSATTLDGEEFNMADNRGEVVALFFMAGW